LYPEYNFPVGVSESPNPVYHAVRESLHLAGLDAEHYGTTLWNPLGDYIHPGQFVLLKPNLVKETHPRDPDGWIYTVTHGSVVRAVADFVWKALKGRGRVMIADAPQTDSSFTRLISLLGLDSIQAFYRSQGLELELVDFRREEWVNRDEVIVERKPLVGDPNGYVAFDLADQSELAGCQGAGRYYGADYDTSVVNYHHSEGRHEYLIAGSAVKCDVFINLPKLKTHKKTGITVNLKNVVGINGDKNWLPHYVVGSPLDGGDQFPLGSGKNRIEHQIAMTLRKTALVAPGVGTHVLRKARRVGKLIFGDNDRVIRSGNWYGNDTTWRMALDLNKLVCYGNHDGSFRGTNPAEGRTYLSFVDGFVAGQGNGPMDPDAMDARIMLFGTNPVDVDATAAVIMGFDPDKIPVVREAYGAHGYLLAKPPWRSIRCASNCDSWNARLGDIYEAGDVLDFQPHFGWLGHIERAR
jgi:uncharacterized protein (DUF362 family)